MEVLNIITAAVFGFAAGFLTCILIVCAIIWWSFSEERQYDGDRREGRDSPGRTEDRG
jgi:hypothetical protein